MIELELLAPAKNAEIGIAAITHGADAVYIAANQFGAREKAGNSLHDIEALVGFAHQFNAKVYVTVNTIIFDDELKQVEQLITDLYRIKVDAIIVQDFSILSMKIPPIAIHASTQMHNISVQKIQFLESYGVNRIVLPREFSLKEISQFHQEIGCEIETFIHGALCVCYSGQCYMSQAITGRSANRGACAQPCRSAYNLVDEDGNYIAKNKHLLSLKDLNLSSHIGKLIEAGATSFKIEGRLKDIAYVKNVTAYYNQIINQYIEKHPKYKRQSSGLCSYTFSPDPERSFNRGFTTHFINDRQRGLSSMETQKSIGKPLGTVSSNKNGIIKIDTNQSIHNGDGLCYFNGSELKGFLVSGLHNGGIILPTEQSIPQIGTLIYRNSDFAFEKVLNSNSATRTIATQLKVEQNSSNLIFSAIDEDGNKVQLTVQNTFLPAQNVQSTIQNIQKQLCKSGSTIFSVTNVGLSDFTQPVFIPISTINTIRRQLLNDLLNIRITGYKTKLRGLNIEHAPFPAEEVNYKCNISNIESRKILESTGTKVLEPAFEVEYPKSNVELMTSRYCIKYELNMCQHKQNAKPTKQLYLEDNNHRYKLHFDCNNCQMNVLLDK